jgi:ECF transporter S component (folate family)
MLLNSNLIGLPFYSIPLIISSIVCGPVYGFVSALITDTFGTLISGQTYLPLYGLGTVLWGIIPYFFSKKKRNDSIFLGIGLLITHILVTLINTLSNYLYFGIESTLLTLFPRLIILPVNVVILTYTTSIVLNRVFKKNFYYLGENYES